MFTIEDRVIWNENVFGKNQVDIWRGGGNILCYFLFHHLRGFFLNDVVVVVDDVILNILLYPILI